MRRIPGVHVVTFVDSLAMNARTDNRGLYALLGIVFLIAIVYQVCFSISAIQYRLHYDVEAGWPFGLNFDSDRFSYTAPALKALGVQVGDQLVETEGRPYEGLAQVASVLSAKHPGRPASNQGPEKRTY